MSILIFLGLLIGTAVLLPLLLVGLVLRAVLAIAFLPLRLLGFALKLTLGLVLGLIGVILGIVGLIVAVAVTGTMLLLPLLPILLLVGVAWLIWRWARRGRSVVQPTF